MDVSPVILAVASSPGSSPRGIIRLSGSHTFDLLSPHLEARLDDHLSQRIGEERPDRLATRPGQRGLHRARVKFPSFDLPVLALVFTAPHSYTGENAAELQLPGNPILLDRVIDGLLASARSHGIDARRATPGEFTARAFFNGRLSLTQAEGVAATIAAQSDAELRAARLLTSGRLGTLAHALADDLAAALALVEAGIDFTDQEDVVAITPRDLHQRLVQLRDSLGEHLSRAVGAEQLRAIPWVVITGRPNAGKSALFNALLGRERAVVSPAPGTTRDVLAEPLAIPTPHGLAEVMLCDLAGWDDSDGSTMNMLMQGAAREAVARAELILCCVPIDDPGPAHESSPAEPREIVLRTKSDLLHSAADAQSSDIIPQNSSLLLSSFTGSGLNELRRAIAHRLGGRAVSLSAEALALHPRHEAALRAALDGIEQALGLVEPVRAERSLDDLELVAAAMRAALNDLAALAGDITPDDILGRVFATFCVGK